MILSYRKAESGKGDENMGKSIWMILAMFGILMAGCTVDNGHVVMNENLKIMNDNLATINANLATIAENQKYMNDGVNGNINKLREFIVLQDSNNNLPHNLEVIVANQEIIKQNIISSCGVK